MASSPRPDDAATTSRPAVPANIVADLERVGIPAGSYSFKPLSGLRRIIARRMTDSVHETPHFPLNMRVEIDRLISLRESFNAGGERRVSLNDLLIKAAAAALMRSPEANASFTPEGLAFHHHADVAFALAIDGGLITPIVRNAEAKSVIDIATEIKDLSARGRAKRLAPAEYNGGTFTVSNLGMFGVASFGSIINAPQGCILSVGAAERAFVFRDEEPHVATVLNLTLTCDHRVVDGVTGARWLQHFKALVEMPAELEC